MASQDGSTISKEKLVSLMSDLLDKKGEAVVKAIEKKIANKEAVNVKGITFGPEVLREALGQWQRKNPTPSVKTVPTPCAAGASKRWTPTPSAQALACKALNECENAQPYCEVVTVTGNKLAVLSKPSVTSKPTGEYLNSGEKAEVIARSINPKDGRTYVRLKTYCGWVCTRSRKDFSKKVLEAPDAKVPLEPPGGDALPQSHAVDILRAVDHRGAFIVDSTGGDAAAKMEETVPFRALGACAILSEPDVSVGAGTMIAGLTYNRKDEFLVDGVFVNPTDGRAYLHLKDGRGWICERSKSDFTKIIAVPCGANAVNLDLEEESFRRRQANGERKVVVVDRAASEAAEAAAATALEKAARTQRAARSPVLPDGPVLYRTDREIWPEELGPQPPLEVKQRQALRRVYGAFGVRLRENDEDLQEIAGRIDTFQRACAAQKELQQYAETLKKERVKVRNEWVKAVSEALNASGKPAAALDSTRGVSSASAGLSKTGDSATAMIVPVLLRGARWYCATVFGEGSSGAPEEGEEAGGSGAGGPLRLLGPLRSGSNEATEDLRVLQQRYGGCVSDNYKVAEEPAAKRRRTAVTV